MKTSRMSATPAVEKLNDLTGDVHVKPGSSNVSVKTSGNDILISATSCATSGSTRGLTSLKSSKGNVITLTPGSNVTIQTEAAEPVLNAPGSGERQPAASADEQSRPTVPVRVGERLDAVERKLLIATLEAVKGDRKTAAELLGIGLKTIYNRLKEYGLDHHTLPGGRARGS
jgi:transcriptional regulator with GAF, ATPase, and Fis domain